MQQSVQTIAAIFIIKTTSNNMRGEMLQGEASNKTNNPFRVGEDRIQLLTDEQQHRGLIKVLQRIETDTGHLC